jgi:hypothetical protein
MSLNAAVDALHRAELDLANALETAASKHALDADMAQHCRVLARQARDHAALIADRTGMADSGETGALTRALNAIREASAHLLGRHELAGALLLDDLVDLHRLAADAEVAWWIVRQGALVHRDQGLYDLFETCHEDTWNQVRWLKTKIKETAPQVLSH